MGNGATSRGVDAQGVVAEQACGPLSGSTARAAASEIWLFGPARDLLFGCGGLYLLLIGVLALGGARLRALQPEFVFPFAILMLSVPHYGATLLRVYERRQDRRSYVIFSLWASLAVALLFVAGLYSPAIGTLLFTLYLTWSPWHYSGQNYGLALMFLRRQRIDVEPRLRRLIYTSFVLSYALFFLVVHGPPGGQNTLTDGTLSAPARAILFVPLGIPAALVDALLPAVAIAYGVTLLVGGALLWRRAASPRYLLPVALLVLTQAVWFSLPYLLRRSQSGSAIDPFDPSAYGYYLVWLVIGHGVQYLWITSYYARNTGQSRSLSRYYPKALLAGAGVWFVPWLLFAPGALGLGASRAGLLARSGASWLVLGAAVNLHHFVLDGAIWKLRNQRIASVLIRGAGSAPPDGAPSRGWGRRLVWGAAALGLAIGLLATAGRSVVPALLERGMLGPATSVLDALAWIGQDMPNARIQLGARLMRQGKTDAALHNYERSLDIEPMSNAFLALGLLRQLAGDLKGAADFYADGLRIQPGERNLVLALARLEQAKHPHPAR